MGSSFLLVNDLRVHYLRWSANDSSNPIVLIHGLASNARIWELTAPHLVAHGYTCYAPDGRGHGLTDKPSDGYDYHTMTEDLAGFLRACEIEHPLLVGHSWGASIVLSYAAHQKAGLSSPRGIVLIDGGLVQMDQLPGMTWEKARNLLTPPNLAGTPLAEFIQRLESWTEDWEPSEEIFPIILGNFRIEADETISPHLTFERHMRLVRSIWEFPTYEKFKQLRCPVLIMPARPKSSISDSDQQFQEAKERGIQNAHESIRDLKISWMSDSIHDIPLQHPIELAERIKEFASALP